MKASRALLQRVGLAAAALALLGALAMPPSACGFGPWARAGAAAPASSAAASARVEGRGKKTGVVMAMLLVQG